MRGALGRELVDVHEMQEANERVQEAVHQCRPARAHHSPEAVLLQVKDVEFQANNACMVSRFLSWHEQVFSKCQRRSKILASSRRIKRLVVD